MTINLSSKGGSAGLGNATKDPRTLPMSIASYSNLYIKSNYNTYETDTESAFWTYTGRIGQNGSCAEVNDGTYKTIIDWTNKSGNIFNIITPTHDGLGTGEIKVKLTIDGTEYILGPSINTSRRNKRFIIGGTYPFQPVTSDTTEYKGQLGSYNDEGFLRYISKIPYYINYQYIVDPIKYILGGASYLYFEDSFKYEVLLNIVDDRSYYRNTTVICNLY